MKIFKHRLHPASLTVLCLAATLVFSGCSIRFNLYDESSDSSANEGPRTHGKIKTGYGYDTLENSGQKELYEWISVLAKEFSNEKITLDYTLSEKQIAHAFKAYQDDNPEVFWLSGSFEYNSNEYSTVVSPIYTCSKDEAKSKSDKLESIVSEVVKNAPNGSDYEVEKYINDYLVDNCTYDEKAAEASRSDNAVLADEHNAYGALVDKKAVCDGYSSAFQILCNRLNLECVSVTGVGNNDYHSWNAVKIGGSWTFVDTTWNDSVAEKCDFKYLYLNQNRELLEKEHKISKSFSEISDSEYEVADYSFNTYVPECTDMTYNYLERECQTLTSVYDSDNIIRSLTGKAAEKSDSFAFTVSSNLSFEDTYNSLVNDGYLASWIETANSSNDSDSQLSTECTVGKFEEQSVIVVKLKYE